MRHATARRIVRRIVRIAGLRRRGAGRARSVIRRGAGPVHACTSRALYAPRRRRRHRLRRRNRRDGLSAATKTHAFGIICFRGVFSFTCFILGRLPAHVFQREAGVYLLPTAAPVSPV